MTVLRHLATDLPPGELFKIAQAVAQVEAAKISTCVVPGRIGRVGVQSVVFPSFPAARRYGNDARDDATITRC